MEDSGETPEVSAERAAAADARRIYNELPLPSPPPVEVAAGEEPFMKLARERKFDEFRRMSARCTMTTHVWLAVLQGALHARAHSVIAPLLRPRR